ncbi:hypothetical protein [Streptomyces sp. NPDC002324]
MAAHVSTDLTLRQQAPLVGGEVGGGPVIDHAMRGIARPHSLGIA